MSFKEITELYGTSNQLLFTEERVLNYRPGGYHPVALGDILNDGRYEIRHKLGGGGFSTIWLARDNILEQWVAMKILTANRTGQFREYHMLQELTELSNGSLGSKHFVVFLDVFLHHGPNGFHDCLVLELLGPTVGRVMKKLNEEGKHLRTNTVLKISTQLLEAIAFMHEPCYAHGELSATNLLFSSGRLSHMPEEKLFEVLGAPKSEEIVRLDGEPLAPGIPNHLVKSTEWIGWPDLNLEDKVDIRVIDLGETFWYNAPIRIARGGLQAPETIFASEYDHRVDLWRVGLIIYFLTFGKLPFRWSFRVDTFAASMIDFVGELPPEWQPKWTQIRLDARRDFGAEEIGQLPGLRLEERFDSQVHYPELKVLLPVIQGLTRFLPSERISACQALDLIGKNDANDAQRSEA